MHTVIRLILGGIASLVFSGLLGDACWSSDANVAKGAAMVDAAREPYRIGAGDVLEIVTWKEEDFSRPQIVVRTDGKISFPLLTDLTAAGRTPQELKLEIEDKLKAYVSHPVVTVTVATPASQRIYILGEVTRAGEYPLQKNLSVLQAFALAGGFTQWASKNEIILLRREGAQERIYKIDYKEIIKGRSVEQNVLLKADDTIIVP
jgi:polysaccharide export outer membrane protein